MEDHRVLTIPKEQYNIMNSRPVLSYECPMYHVCKTGKDKGIVTRCDVDLQFKYTLFDLTNHEIIAQQLILLIPKPNAKTIDELANNIDEFTKNEVETINIVEQLWQNIKERFISNYKIIPSHKHDKEQIIDEFKDTIKTPIKDNIQSLYEKIKNEPKILEYIVEFRLRKYGHRGKQTNNENINELNKKILRRIQNQVYYQKNKDKPKMTPEEIEAHMNMLKTKSFAWRIKEIKCECGSKFIQANKARHEKTSKVHLRYLMEKEAKEAEEEEEEDETLNNSEA